MWFTLRILFAEENERIWKDIKSSETNMSTFENKIMLNMFNY